MEEEEQPQQDSSCPGESKNGGEAEGRPEKSETHKEEVAGGDGGTQLGVGEEGTQPEGGDGGTQPEGGEGGTQPEGGDGGTHPGGGEGGGKGKEKTGKAKRKEKRLRNEPQSVTGEELCAIHVLDFAEARAEELSNMVKAVSSKMGGKRTFQQLPRHMRRRAMSHNVKRLPRRLREAARKEMDSQGTAKPSRKQRRKTRNLREEYSRRQRKHVWLETHLWHAKRMHMVEMYGYRLADHANDKGVRAAYQSLMHGCLLTDISYYCCIEVAGNQDDIIGALRPLFSSDTGLTVSAKAYRGGQREGKAVLYHAHSYPHHPIGPVQFVWQTGEITNPATVTDNDGKAVGEHERRKLWIFSHPAISQEVHAEVAKAISSVTENQGKREISLEAGALEAECTSAGELAACNVPRVSMRNLKDELVRFRLLGPRSHALLMETLKPALNLQSVLRGKEVEMEQEGLTLAPETSGIPDIPKWWEGIGQLKQQNEAIASCHSTFKSASSPSEFPRGTTIGMVVLDPRLFTPSKRTDMVSAYYPKKKLDWEQCSGTRSKKNSGRGLDSEDSDSEVSDTGSSDLSGDEEMDGGGEESYKPVNSGLQDAVHGAGEELENKLTSVKTDQPVQLSSLPMAVSYSPIWDEGIRGIVLASRTPEHLLNKLRSTQLIKSTALHLGEKAARIPILLVQQSLQAPPFALESVRQSGHLLRANASLDGGNIGMGWDLILPANWATAFWVALIYRGARACGMQELKRCSLEALVPHFPEDFPDTEAGRTSDEACRQALTKKYMRYPPDKRRNYGKLQVPTPFHCPWEELVRKWGRDSKVQLFFPCKDGEESDSHLQPQPSKRPKLEPVPAPSLPVVADDSGKSVTLSKGDNTSEQTDVVEDQECSAECLKCEDKAVSSLQNDRSLPQFYVLRSRDALFRIKHLTLTLSTKKCTMDTNGRPLSRQPGTPDFLDTLRKHGIDRCLQQHTSALIPVKLEVLTRGMVRERAMLCLPSLSDLSSVVNDRSFLGPEEAIHPKGVTVIEDGVVLIGVTALTLKKFKERRMEIKKERAAVGKLEGAQDSTSSSSVPKELHLSPATPSRPVFGYVTSAGNRFSSSKSSGLGLCTFSGLLEAARRCCHGNTELLALVRGEDTVYRFVKMCVSV